MLASSRSNGGKLLAALVVAGLALPPAFAAGAADSKRRPPAVALSLDNISAFTPAMADPRLAAAFAGRAPSASDFKFTPSASKSRPSQLRVAIRARSAAPGRPADIAGATSASSIGALTPASYNLGVAVGADRTDGRQAAVLPDTSNYSLDLGGAYSVTRNIAVTGGVRYKIERDKLSSIADTRRDSQAVYVGTAFKF